MTNETAKVKLPCRIHLYDATHVIDANSYSVCDCFSEEQAKHIVTILNSRPALVEAARGALPVLLASHPESCEHGAAHCQCDHAKAYRAIHELLK
jgi:hypothetical protein